METFMTQQLNTSELDFNKIKDNLKDFMRSQSDLNDYDFEGSNLSILLDAMAYITHYQGVYVNAAVNESFLDTAIRRNSIISHAKSIGYTPNSTKAAQATINLKFNEAENDANNIIGVTIAKGAKFIGSYQGSIYNFVTFDTYSTSYPYSIDIPIKQGSYHTKTFTWLDGTVQNFILNESDIDRDSISLKVNGVFWTYSNGDLTNVDASSQVFYIQENYDNKTELYFGPDSGLFGLRPNNGDTLEVEYIRSDGAAANGVDVFSIPGLVGGYDAQGISISLVDVASLGMDPEDIEDVRFRAPKNYERQDRAVSADDFKAILLDEFGDIDAINVWGGETNDPPQYGKVMISIKPNTGERLSPMTKTDIINRILKPYNIVAITPVIVDPEYVYITINSKVTYYRNKTQKSQGEMIELISDIIKTKYEDSLRDFGSTLRYSSVVTAIDNADVAINSNITDIQMARRFNPDSNNVSGLYDLYYHNPIKPGTIISSSIIKTGGDTYALMDDGLGVMTLYNITQEAFTSINIGTIDYTKGIIYLRNFNIDIDTTQMISIYAVPSNTDVKSSQNVLILFDVANITTDTI
jgi:hypothetical protein